MGSEEICNNGREAFIAEGTGAAPVVLYSGTPSDLSIVKSGSFGSLNPVINGKGDILFDDGNNFEEFIDETSRTNVTPEPSSIALFGTGVLGLAGMARRKYQFARS
ncbi:PEP-CTERM sorting domain-containing protein [Granulicella sp. S190]|uniref:PEP-CTERM sorting domain-containing protein n=1 Tax=Granulicella sp. S190 TaxID=1747226 RepID=UPI001C20A451|nr:PEP-CTERM sorting domain-containing protein [Granulicella sp. S190]